VEAQAQSLEELTITSQHRRIVVDGQDVEAVHAATSEAVARARAGDGPSLLEMKTYRYRGHSRSDPAKYRPDGELEAWKARDPLVILGRRLADEGLLSPEAHAALESDITAEVEAAVNFVDQSPVPAPESLYEDVYVRSPYIHMRAAEKDPAWRAAVRDDRVPEELPSLAPAPAKVGA